MTFHLPRASAAALALVVSSLACLVMAGCAGGSQKKVIAVIPKGRSHLFWQSVHAGAQKAGTENNIEIVWNGPTSETDYAGQIQIVEAMINRRVDAIVLAPIDKKAMVGVVERAAREKIPVVVFDSAVDTGQFVSQVATDNYAAGRLAAERMGLLLSGKGKVAMVAVQPGAASTMAREQGFEDAIKEKFPGIAIVDKRFGMADFAKSLAVAENMLTAHPEVEALFASNESSTVGASQALKQRQSKVKLIGFDWSPTLMEDLKGGLIDSLVVQHPFRMGEESVKSALASLAGKPVVKINNIEPKLALKDNLETAELQERINPDLKKYLGGGQ
jgi:ribose transport system substrate-binding protein